MVYVPIGAKVQVDLWNQKKGRGMAKYYDKTTMNLVNARSEFHPFELQRQGRARVTQFHELVHVAGGRMVHQLADP